MKEYIEREAALSAQNKSMNLAECRERLERLPAADVMPVRHGRWFLDGDYEYINCSECLYPFYMGFDTSSEARQYLAREERWKYCPNCGALMDREG